MIITDIIITMATTPTISVVFIIDLITVIVVAAVVDANVDVTTPVTVNC